MAAQITVDVSKFKVDHDIPIPPPSNYECGRKPSVWKALLEKMVHADSVRFDDAYLAAAFAQYVKVSADYKPRSRVQWVNSLNNSTRVWVIDRGSK